MIYKLVVALLCGWLLATGAAANPEYQCARTPTPILVDGPISQFDSAPRIYMRDRSQVVGADKWNGVDDLSATAKMLFDKNYLYVLVEVQDNELQWPQVPDGEWNWSFDSVQIGFDPKMDGGVGTYGSDDSEFLLTLVGGKPVVQRRHSPKGKAAGLVSSVPLFVARHPAVPGWYLIAAFPWCELGPESPREGSKFAADIIVNDQDTGRERIYVEWTPGIGISKAPSSFATVRLVNKPSLSAYSSANRDAGKPSITAAAARARADALLGQASKLDALLREAEKKSVDVGDQRITCSVVQIYTPFALEDTGKGKPGRADRTFAFLESAVSKAIDETNRKLAADEPKTRNQADMARLRWQNGHFYATDRPVFLYAYIDATPEIATRLGLNDYYRHFPFYEVMESEQEIRADQVKALADEIRQAKSAGLAVTFLLGGHYFPQWMLDKYPDTHYVGVGKSFLGHCMDSPNTRALYSVFCNKVAPVFKEAGLDDLELANELGYACRCDLTLPAFRKYLADTYGTAKKLSSTWGRAYASFDNVSLPEEDAGGAAGYDWLDFNQKRVTGIFRWFSAQVQRVAPSLATDIKVVGGRGLDGSDTTWGIDHEALSHSTTWAGLDSYFSESGIMRSMMYDWYASFAGGRPIVDTECPYIRGGATPEHARFNMWIGAVHGEAGAAFYIWDRTESRPDLEDLIATQPWTAETVGRTARIINRLAPELAKLSTAPAEVRILYSRSSSLVIGSQHLQEMAECYRGLIFTGAKIGFITERQLAASETGIAKIIIVPQVSNIPADALRGLARFAERGGAVLLIGKSSFNTERGLQQNSLGLSIAAGREKTFGKGSLAGLSTAKSAEDYRPRFSAILKAARVDRCPGVRPNLEARRVTMNGHELRVYLNYGHAPALVSMPRSAYDLINERLCKEKLAVPAQGVAIARIERS